MELLFDIVIWAFALLVLPIVAIILGCALYSLLIFVVSSLKNEYRGKSRPRNLEDIIYDPNKKRPIEEPLKQIKTFHWIGYCTSIVIIYVGLLGFIDSFLEVVITLFFLLGGAFFLGGFIIQKFKIKRKPTIQ